MIRRLLPLLALAIIVLGVWWSGVADGLNWASLGRYQTRLTAWIAGHRLIAPLVYIAAYATATALSLPQGAVLTVSGGLLFGTVLGGALAVTGATIGAVILFLIARSALAETVAARGGKLLALVRDGLERDGFRYLLAIRLIPLLPFWLVNLAASLCGMRLLPYATATVLGIAPATFIFASIGAGIGTVLAAGGTPDLSLIFSLPVLGPLIGLAVLTLLPILWRKWRGPHV